MGRLSAFVSLLVLLLGVAASPARACSMCRCGDPTFAALGTDVFSASSFRLGVDWDRADKSQGPPGESENQVQNTLTATLSYSFADRVNLVARVPYSFKSLTTATGGATDVAKTAGLADPEFFAWIQLWDTGPKPGLGRRAWVSLQGGVKSPWGENNRTDAAGVPLEQHVQPGTGSTDPFAGLGGVYLVDLESSLFGSAQYRWTGTNSRGYRYGRIFLANVAYERKLGAVFDAILELNYRWAGKDIVNSDGELDGDTGGAILYVTPRALVSLGGQLVARVSVLIPTFRNLNGSQTERAIVSAGVTYSFGP